jgi:hypothetical protein
MLLPSVIQTGIVFEYAPMPLLLMLAATCRRCCEHSARVAKDRSRQIKFEEHRGEWLLSSVKRRSHLLYSDSVLMMVEGLESWREAQLTAGVAEVESGCKACRLTEKEVRDRVNEYRSVVQSRYGQLQRLCKVKISWQQTLFCATFPEWARLLPLSWTPKHVRTLAMFTHCHSRNCKEIARQFWQTLEASPLALGDEAKFAMTERVIKHISEWSSCNRRWEVKDAYLGMFRKAIVEGDFCTGSIGVNMRAAAQRDKRQHGLQSFFGST